MQADVRRKRVTVEWDEDAADVSDGESSDDDDDNDIDDNEADERDDELGAAVEQSMADDEEEPDDNNDFTVDIISDSDTSTEDSEEISQNNGKSFKEVGDNLDKNIRPSFQRISHQTKSVHYFHTLAVRDRIDFSDLSESVPHGIKISLTTLLPSPADLANLFDELQVIVTR